MARNNLHGLRNQLRNGSHLFLAFFWVGGYLAGLQIYVRSSDAFFSMMRVVPYTNVSIVGSLFFLVLPFLFSALAVFYSVPYWIFLIAAMKAFLIAFVSLGLCHGFGSAGWIYAWLLLFGDRLAVPVLYLFWLRQLSGRSAGRGWSALLTLCWYLVVCVIEIRTISSLLAGVIN